MERKVKEAAKQPDSTTRKTVKKAVLTVHKNTKQQRDSKSLRKLIVSEARDMAQIRNISGYTITVWNDDNEISGTWNTSKSNIPVLLVSQYSKLILDKVMNVDSVNNIIDHRFY